ncbi:hypothetical protein MERGE_000245 [Pneumocystis wakefieldiae]|uniref:Presequence translocated-associated motor subunit PAM17 n=1 Tax=Pneumocystis wakefieldiae TaxID=38082 RepID=A0A899FJ59_9ASCO|nr:hypothetical protein MERGE_000245 [Pneumocystis wakefieldiae]
MRCLIVTEWTGFQSAQVSGFRLLFIRFKSSTTNSKIDVFSKNFQDSLSWNEFLYLRRQNLRSGLIASIPSSFVGLSLGYFYFATIQVDPTQTIFGIDPFVVYLLATLASGGAGWLLGRPIVQEKERDFFLHIQKNRVDPRYQSINNPVPDYYGEKIGSLSDYRRWLRDCRAYRKKAPIE